MQVELRVLDQKLSVCKVLDVPSEVLRTGLYFIGRTDEELSLVCETGVVPDDAVKREDGWRAFRIEGTLDFALTGILARISSVLADAGVGIFAVSTYNTDYILVKSENLEIAIRALFDSGYVIK